MSSDSDIKPSIDMEFDSLDDAWYFRFNMEEKLDSEFENITLTNAKTLVE